MYCLQCGNKLPDNAIFCNQCGRRQNTAANPTGSSNMAPAGPSMTGISTDDGQASSGTMPLVQGHPQSSSTPTTQGTPLLLSSAPRKQNSSTQPAQPSFLLERNVGSIMAGIGGIVGLLSFFFMPYLSYGFISATGQQLASLGYQAGSQYNSSSFGYDNNQTQFNGLLFLWLLPVIAGIIILIAGVILLSRGGAGKKVAAGWLIALAVLAILGLVGAYVYLTAQIQNSTSSPVTLTSVIGSGIWVYIIAMIAVIVGGIIQTRSSQ
jgi:hypothetical protein